MTKKTLLNNVKEMLETTDGAKIVRDTLILEHPKYDGYNRVTVEIRYDLFNHVLIELKGHKMYKTATCTRPMEEVLKTVTVSKIFNKKVYLEFQEVLENFGITTE